MIEPQTPSTYGWPNDSFSDTEGLTRYFMASSKDRVTDDFSVFVSRRRTRTGKTYINRSDFGILRTISTTFLLPTPESIRYWEFYFRNNLGPVLLPVWGQDFRFVSNSGTTINVDTLQRDVAINDYLLILKQDYSKYSIRRILSANLGAKSLVVDSLFSTYYPGDFLVPMMLGKLKESPQFTYSEQRTKCYLPVIMSELPLSKERNLIA